MSCLDRVPAVSLPPSGRRDQQSSIQPLRQHRISNFDEPGDIRAIDVIDAAVRTLTMLHSVGVDFFHDHVQAFVHVGMAPGQAQGVLAHFRAGGGNAAGVAGLAGGVESAGLQ